MNKHVYIKCINHLDLMWLRCFQDHFCYKDQVIRPYSEIAEAVFEKWIELLKQSGCKYSIEQSWFVRTYLENNPDKQPLFKQLVQNGQIELLGGGESVIDYNLVHGESIVRNHLYSIEYYSEQFGYRPTVGAAPDTFGLSAQLPQIFRQVGYESLPLYSRVFKRANPFWKGLDGSLIHIATSKREHGILSVSFGEGTEALKYVPCVHCSGEGCRCCDYTGIDYSERHDTSILADRFAEMAESDYDEFVLLVKTEEQLQSDRLLETIAELSERYQINYEFLTFEEDLDKYFVQHLIDLQSGTVKAEDIDDRVEANPVATGGYLSRIEVKKANRQLEDLLLSAEKFAAMGADFGLTYPRRKIADLWRLMGLLQFHDSVTSTHVDAVYQELARIIRKIRAGAYQVYREAMHTLECNTHTPVMDDGFQALLLFNPLNWEVKENVFDVLLPPIDRSSPATKLLPILADGNGSEIPVIDYNTLTHNDNTHVRVQFKDTSLPSVGFTMLYCKVITDTTTPDEAAPSARSVTSNEIVQNEYYQIQVGPCGIENIHDKELEEDILLNGAGNLLIQEDYGSPWETLARPYNAKDLNDVSQCRVSVVESAHKQEIIIEGDCSNVKYNMDDYIRYVRYEQHITLYQGLKKVYFTTHVDWDTTNMRIMSKFPLNFQPPDDKASYEIPYGILERDAYRPEFGKHMDANGDWPALNFVSCHNQKRNYCVNLFNKGLPANRVKNGTMYLGLLRSSDIPVWLFDIENARDQGKHTFEYMLTSHQCSLKDGQVVQQGLEYNTTFMAYPARRKEAPLAPRTSFLSNHDKDVVISAMKRGEHDDKLVLRSYEPYGEQVVDRLHLYSEKQTYASNLLEEDNAAASELSYNPREIKTVKAGQNSLFRAT